MEIDYTQFDLLSEMSELYWFIDEYDGKTIGDAYTKLKDVLEHQSEYADTEYKRFLHSDKADILVSWLEAEPDLHSYSITNVQKPGGMLALTLSDDLENPNHVYVLADAGHWGYYNSVDDGSWEKGNDLMLEYVNSIPESYGNSIEMITYDSGANNAVNAKIMSDRIGTVHSINGMKFPQWYIDKYAKELDNMAGDIREYTSELTGYDKRRMNLSSLGLIGSVSDLYGVSYYGGADAYREAKERALKGLDEVIAKNADEQIQKALRSGVHASSTLTSESHAVTHGMDLASTEQLAAKMLESADKIKDVLSSAGVTLDATSWLGPDIQEFKEKWQGLFAKQLQLAATALVESSEVVEMNRKEQVAVSE
ncbi:MAG: hypothetical protein LBL41_01540 [Bifidobacteriaceae bacterium]|jgi:hypothetical protein|nr:hypothetical protein [Bifidobacteriaceae bacterium]